MRRRPPVFAGRAHASACPAFRMCKRESCSVVRELGLTSHPLAEVEPEEASELLDDAPSILDAREVLSSSNIARDVVQLMKIKPRIASHADRDHPLSHGPDQVRIDKRRRTKERDDVVRLTHGPEIGRHELTETHHGTVASVALVPSAMVPLLESIRRHLGSYDNGGHVHSMDAGAPRAQLHVVIFRGPNTVFHPPERGGKHPDPLEDLFPECEVRPNEAYGPFASADLHVRSVILKRKRSPVGVGQPRRRRGRPLRQYSPADIARLGMLVEGTLQLHNPVGGSADIIVREGDDGGAGERNTGISSMRQPLPGLEAVSNEAACASGDLANDFGGVV